MDKYAVIGNPIGHSKSPQIHQEFARQSGQMLDYSAQLVRPEEFNTAVQSFFDGGGLGLNITVPFKEDAWRLAVQLSERAKSASAVNTLFQNEKGETCGDNTDGAGLVRDITANLGGTIQGSRVLVLGAGGASRGILLPIIRENPSQLHIANRTVEKAESLAEDFRLYSEKLEEKVDIEGGGFEGLENREFDLVINATSASLQGDLPPLPRGLLSSGAWCYDLMYSDEPTPFMAWARANGAEKVFDGLGMLVEQAAESFYIWRGIRPQTRTVIDLLRK